MTSVPIGTRVTLRPPSADQASRLRALVRPAAVRPATPPQPALVRASISPPRVRAATVITISSGKGGVGKTTLSINLSIALAALGRRVTLLDADLGMANADVMCGLAPARRLDDVVAGGGAHHLTDITVEAPGGFRLVPGSVGVERMAGMNPADRGRLMHALQHLEDHSDVLIIDTGAGMGPDVLTMVRHADLAIIVATPEPTSITDAYALMKCASLGLDGRSPVARAALHAPRRMGLIINQARSTREGHEVHERIGRACAQFLHLRPEAMGVIHVDERVGDAVRRRQPLLLASPSTRASTDIREIAAALATSLSPCLSPAAGRQQGVRSVPTPPQTSAKRGRLAELFGLYRRASCRQ